VDDHFTDPQRSSFGPLLDKPNRHEFFFENGRYVAVMRPPPMRSRWVWAQQNKGTSDDFACQAVGRILADKDQGWAIYFHSEKQRRVVTVRLRRDGAVEVADAAFPEHGWVTMAGPFRHPRIRPGNEFNTVLVTLRRGRTLQVYVNEEAVTYPLPLDPPLGPVSQGLSLWQRDVQEEAEIRAEFTRFTVWLRPPEPES
jgi:hypothetical protein